MLKRAFSAGAILIFLAGLSAAQDVGHFDASIAFGGVLGQNSSSSIHNLTIVPTNSALVLGSFRYRFNRTHGVILNIGRTVDSQIFVLPPDNFRIQTTVLEYSGAYVLSPFHFEKLEPFFLAGIGAVRFNPGKTYIDGFQSSFGAASQTSLAFLYGGGVDYPVWKFLGLRLQYRGLLYKEPNFHLQQFVTGARSHMPEASIGVVYKF